MDNIRTTAPNQIASRRIFSGYFKQRWQNQQNCVNDSLFLSQIPKSYQQYYNTYVFPCLAWARGFVPNLHKSDFFSTGLGYTVCEILTNETFANGFRLSSKTDLTQHLIDEWQKSSGFIDEIVKLIYYSISGGNALAVLSINKKDVYLTAYPVNRCIFSTTKNNTVTDCVLFNRFGGGDTIYFAKETRATIDNQGYYKIELFDSGLMTVPEFSGATLNSVPNKIKAEFIEMYGDIELGEWYTLPSCFCGIGVFNIKNKSINSCDTSLEGYSDSSLYTALDILYSIDYNYTQQQIDMYKAKTLVLVPKQMQNSPIQVGGRVDTINGLSFSEAINKPQLDDDFYVEVKNNDGTTIKPEFIQANLRVEEHKALRDCDIELLANKVGLSASSLLSSLKGESAKTATEIENENNTTSTTIQKKRALMTPEINKLLQIVARFYNVTDDISLQWGRLAANSSIENQQLLLDYQAGLLPLKRYLKKRWIDLTEDEAEQWANEIEEEQKKKREQEIGLADFNEKNYFNL